MKILSKNSDQIAGLIKIICIPAWNIAAISGLQVSVISNDKVFMLQCAIDSLHHQAELIENENGKFFQHDISGFLPGDKAENDPYLNLLSIAPVILLTQTDDGSWVRIGDSEHALSFTYQYSTKSPGYDLSFKGDLIYKSMQTAVPDY